MHFFFLKHFLFCLVASQTILFVCIDDTLIESND